MDINQINQMDPEAITNYVVQEYYKENLTPFFAILHPNILFISIGNNQVVEGIKNLETAYQHGMQHSLGQNLQYDILSFNSKEQKVSPVSSNVLIQMQIRSTDALGKQKSVCQRISVNWRKYKKLKFAQDDVRSGWFAMHIHVSVGIQALQEQNMIQHLAPSIMHDSGSIFKEDSKYLICDCKRYKHYVSLPQIVRIFAKELHCYVYMQNGEVIETRKSLQEFEAELSENEFIRIHKSQIVNRAFVVGINNYKVTMSDGSVFPVPRGKYKAVKSRLLH